MTEPRDHLSIPDQPVRVRRHLIDPHAPRPPRDAKVEAHRLTKVQQWVMSSLAVTTILHMSVGLILGALYLDDPPAGARVGLNLIAGAFGVMAVAAALAIHGRRIVSWWLLLGFVPTVVGLWLVQG
jgi:hypothetical protein